MLHDSHVADKCFDGTFSLDRSQFKLYPQHLRPTSPLTSWFSHSCWPCTCDLKFFEFWCKQSSVYLTWKGSAKLVDTCMGESIFTWTYSIGLVLRLSKIHWSLIQFCWSNLITLNHTIAFKRLVLVLVQYKTMEDNSRYILNWWSWDSTLETGSHGAAVRVWLSNCEVAGSVPTRLRWCALLRSSKQSETALQCFSQFSAFDFTDWWWISNWKFQQNLQLLTKCLVWCFDGCPPTRKFKTENEKWNNTSHWVKAEALKCNNFQPASIGNWIFIKRDVWLDHIIARLKMIEWIVQVGCKLWWMLSDNLWYLPATIFPPGWKI